MTVLLASPAKTTDRVLITSPVPPEAAEKICSLANGFLQERGIKAKQIEPERLALQLACLGDFENLPRNVIAKASAAASSVSQSPPFEVTLNRAGSIAGRTRNLPFMLWESSANTSLSSFKQSLAQQLAVKGLPPLPPHKGLTAFYSNVALPERCVASISWVIRDLALFRSKVGQGEHEPIGFWSLGSLVHLGDA